MSPNTSPTPLLASTRPSRGDLLVRIPLTVTFTYWAGRAALAPVPAFPATWEATVQLVVARAFLLLLAAILLRLVVSLVASSFGLDWAHVELDEDGVTLFTWEWRRSRRIPWSQVASLRRDSFRDPPKPHGCVYLRTLAGERLVVDLPPSADDARIRQVEACADAVLRRARAAAEALQPPLPSHRLKRGKGADSGGLESPGDLPLPREPLAYWDHPVDWS